MLTTAASVVLPLERRSAGRFLQLDRTSRHRPDRETHAQRRSAFCFRTTPDGTEILQLLLLLQQWRRLHLLLLLLLLVVDAAVAARRSAAVTRHRRMGLGAVGSDDRRLLLLLLQLLQVRILGETRNLVVGGSGRRWRDQRRSHHLFR